MNSRLISSPTTKKKTVRSPWLTQWSSECANARVPHWNPRGVSHHAANAGPRGELLSTSASSVASPRSNPDDGPQRTNSNAADWMRWPSEPSIASASELSSQVPA